MPIPYSHLAVMSEKSLSRVGSGIFLESLRFGSLMRGGRITAAATTGPAHGPLPASSQPAINIVLGESAGMYFFVE